MTATTRSLGELEQEAAHFVAALAPTPKGATLITLRGELGAGKTAFTKAAAKALGVAEEVTSPTFVLEKIYALANKPFARLIHIDAYRLEGASELPALGFDEAMREPGNLIFLEWPERVGITAAHHTLTLALQEDGTHTITYG